ncbi:hypothetical protein Pflav_038430 [Phytohabitans flavus]|uniref:Uncharacterized protein n=1 Tax=Phytohabitans flavus TaxID=1076124 RepID=A0A6F8XUC6_9ACTN|nr:hypothetical protein Pflav_038430 [Phytohabitans flavus]
MALTTIDERPVTWAMRSTCGLPVAGASAPAASPGSAVASGVDSAAGASWATGSTLGADREQAERLAAAITPPSAARKRDVLIGRSPQRDTTALRSIAAPGIVQERLGLGSAAFGL